MSYESLDMLRSNPTHNIVPFTAPFESKPCLCVKYHRPVPVIVELHHPFPQAEQIKIYGTVINNETVPLCATAHDTVHFLLNKLLRNQPMGNRGNDYIRNLAKVGYEMVLKAREENGL